MAEQGGWVALERGLGGRRVVGALDGASPPVTIAAGDGWTMQVGGETGSLDLQVFDAGGVELFGQTVGTSLPARYDVVVDPVSNEFYVTLGDTTTLLPGELRAQDGSIRPGGPADADRPSALCLELRQSL
jgi:hypothetical protein